MTYWVAVAKLASILAGVGLVTTRLTLIAHELVGHGLVAIACGGRIRDVGLFWFAGGWITYDLPGTPTLFEALAITLGGIVLEIVIGFAMWFVLARGTSLAARVTRAAFAAIALHGVWYLAVGTAHGWGDGRFNYMLLGDKRWLVSITAGLVMIVFAFFAARVILGVLAATLPKRRVIGVVVAVVAAAVLQGGLAVTELVLSPSDRYGTVMQPQRERVVAREMQDWEREQRARGVDVDAEARREREQALQDKHREPPFAVILGVLVAIAIAFGAWRSRGSEVIDTIPKRFVVRTALAAALSVALVIALDTAFV